MNVWYNNIEFVRFLAPCSTLAAHSFHKPVANLSSSVAVVTRVRDLTPIYL